MPRALFAPIAMLTALFAAVPARACSVGADYIRPSNFELVQIADAIVVVSAEAAAGEDRVRFRVEQTVKGAPPAQLTLGSAVIGTPPPSDLTNLATSNPEGYQGPCNRMSFVSGARYLLFLAHGANGTWRQVAFPFSRINEDYRGEGTIWMRTVRRYAALQQRLAPMAQLDALAGMQASGRTPDGQVLAPSERTDIADHLSSISQWKPTAWLLRVYERSERGEPVAMRPDSANQEVGPVNDLTALALGEPSSEPGPQGHERVSLAVLAALAAGHHPDAMPLFERLAAAPDTGPAVRGQVLLYFGRNGRFDAAYAWIERALMPQLLRVEQGDAMRLLRDVASTMEGDHSEEVEALWPTDPGALERDARWRRDPHALATWPELALALYWYQVRTFGADHAINFPGAIGAIPLTDFRARPQLTLALAANYDQRVIDWATAELARPPVPRAGEREVYGRERLNDPAILPLRVLVMDGSVRNTAALIRIFCEGGPRRRLAILALGQWGDSLSGELLGRMAAFPRLDEYDRHELRVAAIEVAAREIDEGGEAGLLGGEDENWLVTRLLSRRPPPVSVLPENRAPLACPT
jgi:hypothetical protein